MRTMTPGVNYCYDGQSWSNGQCSGTPSAPSIGRTTQVLSSVSSNTYSYDTLGRVTASSQTTGSTPYSFQYSYNAAGLLTSETYPSNRVVSYAYNAVGRTKTVAGVLGTTTIPYAGDVNNPIAYVPHGAISSLKLGNGIVETTTYNARLQPTSIQAGSLMTLGYTYGTTQNNGNVLSQTITRGSQAWSQTYSYTDGLNRLTGASESGSGSWSQTYGYDNFGNRWLSGYTNLPSPSNQVPNGNWFLGNKILNSPSGAWTYDNAGNLQAMAGMPGWSFTYDAENRQITAVTASSPTTTYQYDGEGRRVTKNWNGQTTTFVYDAFGNLAAEYGGPVGSTGTQYLTSDHLGSTRLVTDSSGASVNCYDYLPFGEEIGSGTAGRPSSCFGSGSYPAAGGATNVEFTSKQRDAETGIDYFGARYMSSAQGRFTSPDQPLVDQYADDPQSWNLYSYVRNNPLSNIDPSGQDCITTSNQTDASVTVTVASGTCNGNGGAYVNGTVDLKSLTYNGTSVGYSYTSYDANTIFGTGTVGLGSSGNIGALSPYGQEFYNQMSARRAANNGTIATFAAGQALFAAAYASIPAVVAGLTAMGETGALGPGVGLLKLAQRYGLNANSPKARQLLENLDMKVEDFVGRYRLGSIKQAEGWKFDGMTVKQALDAGGRKLLTDGRFDK